MSRCEYNLRNLLRLIAAGQPCWRSRLMAEAGMTRYRLTIARRLAGLVGLALLACMQAPATPRLEAPPPAVAGPTAPLASTADAPPLRSVELPTATVSATSAPLWVGVDYGMFRRYGLDVEVTGMAPAATTQAVQSGSVPLAATAGAAVTAFANGADELV